MSSSVIPRSRSRAAMRMASSSEVVVLDVAKRKWSTSSSPRNIPKWVWVLPTSIVRSTAELSEGSESGDALGTDPLERSLQLGAIRRIQLEQWFEHEPPILDLHVRHVVVRRVDLLALDDQHVDVQWARRVAGAIRIPP